jgi:hypothetical protein
MKNVFYFILSMLLLSCSSTQIIDSWKNKEYTTFKPKKVLIIGITQNLTGRKMFEMQLKDALNSRGLQAEESFNVFDMDFTNSKQTEEDIQEQLEKLAEKRYDAVLISAVKGVEEKTVYSRGNTWIDYHWRRFGRYYYHYQDVYFNPGYYQNYNIYNIESSLYDFTSKDKVLVWVASYSITDPTGIDKTVKEYVGAMIKGLEKENLIPIL